MSEIKSIASAHFMYFGENNLGKFNAMILIVPMRNFQLTCLFDGKRFSC